MPAVLRGVHASPASKVMCMLNSISETQDEDRMPMCLSNSQLESQDVDSMSMCQSNSHCDAVMMGPPDSTVVKSVHASPAHPLCTDSCHKRFFGAESGNNVLEITPSELAQGARSYTANEVQTCTLVALLGLSRKGSR
jgi:hypothetical protein